jgi:molybdopterin converting factor small subunit
VIDRNIRYTEIMKPTIQIKLFASLAQYMPDNAAVFSIDPGLPIRDLAQTLGIPLESARLIFVNGVKCDLATPLSGGERVAIFPPVGGG